MNKQRMKKELIHVNVLIPKTLRRAIEEHVKTSLHTNISDFVRCAIREKLRRDASKEAHTQ